MHTHTTGLHTPLPSGVQLESFLSPATRIVQNAQAISAALQFEDSEIDESVIEHSHSSSPDTSRWQGADGANSSMSTEVQRVERR